MGDFNGARNACEKALSLDESHWPAVICKARALSHVPSQEEQSYALFHEYVDHAPGLLEVTKEAIRKEAEDLWANRHVEDLDPSMLLSHENETWYQVMGVDRSGSAEEIEQQWKKLRVAWAPGTSCSYCILRNFS